MRSGALAFLAAFIALSASWAAFVLAPQLQFGRSALVKPTGGDNLYPLARPGTAAQGAEVYRSLGCVYCHSQQVGQDGVHCEVVLTEVGTNATATLAALAKLDAALGRPETLANLPKTVRQVPDVNAGEAIVKSLTAVGAKAQVSIVPTGLDIARGYGPRRTVAQDYVYDSPVQLGERRAGPDLSNIGLRKPDIYWQLRHLYAPKAVVPDSTMPPYRFLFTLQKIGKTPARDAIQLPGEFAAPAGFEIVPSEQAKALAAYLLSLHSDAPLYEAPFTTVAAAAPATNSPAK